MKTQPDYPFFTRFGPREYACQFAAWLSDKVILRVSKPEPYYPRAEITWSRDRYIGEVPNFINSEEAENVDVLITRDEFMAAYNAAEAFLQAAAREFLPTKPVAYINSAQSAEITALLNHPAFTRPVKTKMLLKVPRMTYAEANAAIKVLNDTRAMFDGPDYTGGCAVIGEAWMQNPAA